MYAQEKRGKPGMSGETMLSARIHEYQKPLVVESIPKPSNVTGESILVKVGAAGLCQRKIKHAYQSFPLKEINQAIGLLRQGQVMGRAVIVP